MFRTTRGTRRRSSTSGFGSVLGRFLGRGWEVAARTWRRSMQIRVIVSTLALSLIVLILLGFVLVSQITSQVLGAKLASSQDELARNQLRVEQQLAGSSAGAVGDIPARIEEARQVLVNRSSAGSGSAPAYELVLISPTLALTTGQLDTEVPQALRNFVGSGQASYQYATTTRADGSVGSTLVLGTPIRSSIPNLELYLMFPLDSEQDTLALVRGTLIAGCAVLLLLLAGVAGLVARQVVLPVRSAAQIAGRFADGRLNERMPVRGEDDMAKLATSFNDMAESLSKQISQLEEFGNLQRQFTSDVSHELRTPLTTVRMAADMIADSELPPELVRTTELMVTELDRFETLLGELLEISRHDAGVAELNAERLDLAMPIAAALNTVRHIAESSGTEIIVDIPAEPVLAEVDSRRIERVLRNLLANAIDHSNGKPVTLKMRADSEAVAITVRDYGVGLRPGEDKLVFNRFWRADPSRVRRSGGTGLGLAMSYEDARLHHGRLEAWGELGRGACFRVTLPLKRGHKVLVSPLPLKPLRPKQVDESARLAEDIGVVGT